MPAFLAFSSKTSCNLEEGTKGLLARYQKDTPGQGQVIEKEYNPDDDFSGKIKKKLKELLNTDNRSKK